MAHKLCIQALDADHPCFSDLTVDGRSLRVARLTNTWVLMKGGVPDEKVPTSTVEFFYWWPNAARMAWAAAKLAAGFRAIIVRRRMNKEREERIHEALIPEDGPTLEQ